MQNLIDRVGLDVFMPFVMAACAELPEPMAQAYIRQACIDFCVRSGTLRRKSFISQQRNVKEYPVWPDACEEVVRVNEVHVDSACYRGGRNTCCFDHCGCRFTIAEGMLHISSAPQWDKPDSIEVRFVAKPARDACEVDATLYDDWHEAIVDGALAQLYLLPGYKWTSPQLAGVRDVGFARRIRQARVQALKSDTGDTIMARAPSFV